MGQLVELKLESGIFWSLGEAPPTEADDLRAMAVEAEMPLTQTPKQLHDAIVQYAPTMGEGFLWPATVADT